MLVGLSSPTFYNGWSIIPVHLHLQTFGQSTLGLLVALGWFFCRAAQRSKAAAASLYPIIIRQLSDNDSSVYFYFPFPSVKHSHFWAPLCNNTRWTAPDTTMSKLFSINPKIRKYYEESWQVLSENCLYCMWFVSTMWWASKFVSDVILTRLNFPWLTKLDTM